MRAACPLWEIKLDITQEVLRVLDEVLSLNGRSATFTRDTPLLGAIPELDSMAVVSLITTLEEQFSLTVDDDDIDGSTFVTVGSLTLILAPRVAPPRSDAFAPRWGKQAWKNCSAPPSTPQWMSGASRKASSSASSLTPRSRKKLFAHPVDSRLLEIARRKVVAAAKRCGIGLKQTFAAEGKTLQRQAGGYAHAKQFKRLRRVVKRQRTILGILIREAKRKMLSTADNALTLTSLNTWLERAERIRTQQRKDKNKLYALHAPEVECIGKGKTRKPYEFGVKVSVAVTHKQGLLVGARSFTGNPYDGHILSAQMEQSTILLQDLNVAPQQVVVDLGFRGKDVDQANPDLEIIHRGRIKTMTKAQRRWLKRRQAVEPAIGHLKSDNRMQRCWLQGATGDALHALCCAVGYNLRWLMRAVGWCVWASRAFCCACSGSRIGRALLSDSGLKATQSLAVSPWAPGSPCRRSASIIEK